MATKHQYFAAMLTLSLIPPYGLIGKPKVLLVLQLIYTKTTHNQDSVAIYLLTAHYSLPDYCGGTTQTGQQR
ncbi:hypothetical protein VRK_32240 [Vibrio sp. MEBiC08052]|nr:hypothetical protein VRK_32240 [Vibrio sp. MEBiC08052]